MSIASRIAARGWATRASNRLETLCRQETIDDVELKDAIEEFDKRLEALDAAQVSVERETETDKMEEEVNAAADFRERVRAPRVKAMKILVSESRENTPVVSNSHSNHNNRKTDAKLPKLELPSFSGDVLEWTSFWDQYQAVVHNNSDLPDITKYSYLLSLLKGEAKAAIQGLSLNSAHYQIACDLLQKRFGRPTRIIFSHIQELLSINVPRQSNVSVLWKTYDALQTHVRSLQTLGITGEQYGIVLTPLILSRLSPELRMEWAREGDQREGDLDFLLKFLQQEIERRERSQTFSKDNPPVSRDKEKRGTSPGTAAALHVSKDSGTTPECALCNRHGHPLVKCYSLTRVPVAERKPLLRQVSACFKCLSTNKDHVYRNCTARCSKCKRKHHALLCDPPVPAQPGPSANECESNTGNDMASVVNESDTQAKRATISVSGAGVTNKVNSVTGNDNAKHVLLQTARIQVQGKRGMSEATVLFDTGSDKTYISESLVAKVGPEWICSQNMSYAAFGSAKASSATFRNVYNVLLQGREGQMEKIVATEVPVICAPLFRPSIPENILQSFGEGIDFEDVGEGDKVQVDLLVGLDNYWRLMTTDICMPDYTGSHLPGLVAQRSIFGWVLSGPMPDNTASFSGVHISHQLLCLDVSESLIRNLWELESVGICGDDSPERDPVLCEFEKNVQFSNGRYEVSLPWKSEGTRPQLLNNEKLAKVRLDQLTRRLSKDPSLEERYHAVLQDMCVEGIVEEVPSDQIVGPPLVYYMPHRPVVKESSLTTKVRPVFDASAKGFNKVSLNDCLHSGPSLLPDLPGILIRFRRWKVALSADVTKAFLQIGIHREDRDVHRFLWNDRGKIRVMRFLRVPFGNKSSPFLLNATVKHHLSKFPQSRVVQELLDNLYVDDWLSGCDDDSEGCAMLKEAQGIMGQASMSLTKWGSNSEEVGNLLYREFHESPAEESLKVLGMRWLALEDCFSFDGLVVPGELCVTKRVVLSFVARLFDPLGFLSPFIMTVKCLFQELWRKGLEWDEVVPEDIQKQFIQWVEGLQYLRTWKIPRSYTGTPWRDIEMFQLEAFGDASQSAYGACVYLVAHLSDGTRRSSLVLSRAKVAPLKRVSLPRLELLAALLCARLVVYVREALKLSEDVAYHCWTDSTVTLAWIQSDPHKWKPFVGNRVAEIQRHTDPGCWFHCSGRVNPADLLTRGIPASQLMQSDLWLHGPGFLLRDLGRDSPPTCNETGDEMDCTSSVVPGYQVVTSSVSDNHVPISTIEEEMDQLDDSVPSSDSVQSILELSRWSSFGKALRVVAWVLRFLSNLRRSKVQSPCVSGGLSYEELERAKLKILTYVQQKEYSKELHALRKGLPVPKGSSLQKLSPFIGGDGLLRVHGRLQFSGLPYDAKHPVIIPKGALGVLLARHVHQTMKHAGVNGMLVALRNQYWVIGGRRLCKLAKRECFSCQRLDAPSGKQTMAPLPAMRVTQAPPFAVTGIDHGGPLYCCDFVGKKFYILLFTCAVVRAVHLELVESLSCEATLQAIRRFISRRGMPTTIWSDNAKGFRAAKEKMLSLFGGDGPDWKFIVPQAPWWGGWWERMVGLVKSLLKRSIGKGSLTRVELETTLHEVEACVNSRPLAFVGDELDSGHPLSPSHFLIGRSTGSRADVGQGVPRVSAQDLVLRQEFRTQLLDNFWSCWVNEYIRSLPTCKGSPANQDGIKEGKVVLVRNQGCNRLHWPIGVVEKVFPGRDGLIRTVEVRTAKGVYLRPIQLIHDLEISDRVEVPPLKPTSFEQAPATDTEIDQSQNSSDQSPDKNEPVKCSRSGRQVKPPSRLDL